MQERPLREPKHRRGRLLFPQLRHHVSYLTGGPWAPQARRAGRREGSRVQARRGGGQGSGGQGGADNDLDLELEPL